MNFSQAITSGFKKYGTFTGRASRSEYWFWVLFCVLASVVLQMVDIMVLGANVEDPNEIYILSSLFSLATLVPGLAVTARRLHDTERSGWWMLIALTLLGIIPLIIWYCQQGTAGDNRFGPNPLGNAP